MTYAEIVAIIAEYERVWHAASPGPPPTLEEGSLLDAKLGEALDALEGDDPPRLWAWDEGSFVSTLAELEENFIEQHWSDARELYGEKAAKYVTFPRKTELTCYETLEKHLLFSADWNNRGDE